jgi:hypothetical protein
MTVIVEPVPALSQGYCYVGYSLVPSPKDAQSVGFRTLATMHPFLPRSCVTLRNRQLWKPHGTSVSLTCMKTIAMYGGIQEFYNCSPGLPPPQPQGIGISRRTQI